MMDKPGQSGDPIPSELAQEDESFTDLVEEFVRGLGERVDQIAKAVDSGDYAGLKVLTHQMKGSAGSYGYPVLTEQAAEMELHAIGEELEAVQADLDSLRDLVSRVVIRI
jgi:HPt (histidine-containing phosphotransfer) domain-containing protein